MTNPTPQKGERPSGLENIKALNATIPKDSSIAKLLGTLQGFRKKLDILVKDESERFKLYERANREKKKREDYEERQRRREKEAQLATEARAKAAADIAASNQGSDAQSAQAVKTPQEPRRFVKRIGSTNYRVNVHFSDTSKETMNDKIIRANAQYKVSQY